MKIKAFDGAIESLKCMPITSNQAAENLIENQLIINLTFRGESSRAIVSVLSPRCTLIDYY